MQSKNISISGIVLWSLLCVSIVDISLHTLVKIAAYKCIIQ